MKNENFQVRYNVMTVSSIITFANVKGGMHENCKDVYFVRCIGCNEKYLEGIREMDRVLSQRQGDNQGRYLRVDKLPQLNQPEEISFYADAYRQWENSNKQQLTIKYVKQDAPSMAAVINAIIKTCKTFEGYTANANETIIKNFVIKLLYWTDAVISDFIKEWKDRVSYKLAVGGLLKKQEYLFCYYATLLGIDVIILSPERDLEIEPQLLKLSAMLDLPMREKIGIPKYNKEEFWIKGHSEVSNQEFVIREPANHTNHTNRVVIPPRRTGKKSTETTGKALNHMENKTLQQNPLHQSSDPSSDPSRQERREKEFEELARLASSVVMIAIHDRKGEVMGTGSGIMIGPKGYILTNNHVASGGEYYSVRIEDDDKVYETTEVIKYHSLLDLALIRINRTLKPIPIYKGNIELVRGQKVVAIGSPLGLFNSVSNGIISGFRKFDDVNMIQFTAPISHGSSGGAVLNMYGEVIGISTAGIDRGQNINLAVDYHDITNFVRGFL